MKTEQIFKNTVPSKNQVSENQEIIFTKEFSGVSDNRIKIAFLGNSITRHEKAPHLGWFRECGMAASCLEKDYVHVLINKLKEKYGTVEACICNIATWERGYKNAKELYPKYKAIKDFEADVLIMRCVENCKFEEFDESLFKNEYCDLINYLAAENTKVILTTSFWNHIGDSVIMEIGQEKGCECIYLGDLGEMDEMKAIGQFEDSGVANHPGDLGMQTIAERIYEKMDNSWS